MKKTYLQRNVSFDFSTGKSYERPTAEVILLAVGNSIMAVSDGEVEKETDDFWGD